MSFVSGHLHLWNTITKELMNCNYNFKIILSTRSKVPKKKIQHFQLCNSNQTSNQTLFKQKDIVFLFDVTQFQYNETKIKMNKQVQKIVDVDGRHFFLFQKKKNSFCFDTFHFHKIYYTVHIFVEYTSCGLKSDFCQPPD